MPICNGNTPIKAITYGQTPVKAVYNGMTKIWPGLSGNTLPMTITSSRLEYIIAEHVDPGGDATSMFNFQISVALSSPVFWSGTQLGLLSTSMSQPVAVPISAVTTPNINPATMSGTRQEFNFQFDAFPRMETVIIVFQKNGLIYDKVMNVTVGQWNTPYSLPETTILVPVEILV